MQRTIRIFALQAHNFFESTVMPNFKSCLRSGAFASVISLLFMYPALINRSIGLQRKTILMYATSELWPIEAYFELLRIPGIDVDQKTKSGETALMFVAYAYAGDKGKNITSAKKLKLLLDFNADVHHRAKQGHTALHVAVLNRKDQSISLSKEQEEELITIARANVDNLLGAGADIDAQDALGVSPLMMAVQYNNKEMVEHLLARGANPYIVITKEGPYQGWMVGNFAQDNPEIVSLLVRRFNRNIDRTIIDITQDELPADGEPSQNP